MEKKGHTWDPGEEINSGTELRGEKTEESCSFHCFPFVVTVVKSQGTNFHGNNPWRDPRDRYQ